MTGTEVRHVRRRLGLTQREFARRLGVHKVTVAKWEANMRVPRGTAATLIRLLAHTAPKRAAKSSTAARRTAKGRP